MRDDVRTLVLLHLSNNTMHGPLQAKEADLAMLPAKFFALLDKFAGNFPVMDIAPNPAVKLTP